jgi:hypothetical protein
MRQNDSKYDESETLVMTGGFIDEESRRRLVVLRDAHEDLDAAIAALIETGSTDQMQIARMKRRKLRLKDEIIMLEGRLIPDIIA